MQLVEGKSLFWLTDYSPSLKEAKPRAEMETGTEAGSVGVKLFTGLLLSPFSYLSYIAQEYMLRDSTAHSVQSPPTSIIS